MTDDDRFGAMLVEYQASQDSAQFNDSLVWTSTGITWGLSLLLFGFVLGNLANVFIVISSAILGILFVAFQWQVQWSLRSVKNQKYQRCKEIEVLLGMSQHSKLAYDPGSQTTTYRLICSFMVAIWFIVVCTSMFARLQESKLRSVQPTQPMSGAVVESWTPLVS